MQKLSFPILPPNGRIKLQLTAKHLPKTNIAHGLSTGQQQTPPKISISCLVGTWPLWSIGSVSGFTGRSKTWSEQSSPWASRHRSFCLLSVDLKRPFISLHASKLLWAPALKEASVFDSKNRLKITKKKMVRYI